MRWACPRLWACSTTAIRRSSLVAGAALDRYGAKWVIPLGAALVGLGAMLFGTGNVAAANVGRFLQGTGGAFALVGAVYLINKNFPASAAASFIGATQMFGMAGGSAGQFVVGPLIKGGLPWGQFWVYAGLVGLVIAVALLILLPKSPPAPGTGGLVPASLGSLKTVFLNPQSLLCGFISGLLFIPTTIFGMTWGVRFLQEAPRPGVRRRCDAGGDGAAGLDDWLPAARLHLRPSGPPQAGHPRRHCSCAGHAGLDSLRRPGRLPRPAGGHPAGHRLRRRDAAVLCHQGGQPAGAGRIGYRRGQLPQFHFQRTARPGVRLTPRRGTWRRRHGGAGALSGSVRAATPGNRARGGPDVVVKGNRPGRAKATVNP